MSFFRHTLRHAVIAALLIVAALAAGHQHPLLAASPSDPAFAHAESVDRGASGLSECAVCRALQSTELADAAVSDRLIVHTAHTCDVPGDRPVALPRTRRSPRGPPALHA